MTTGVDNRGLTICAVWGKILAYMRCTLRMNLISKGLEDESIIIEGCI